jgi:hypothetical protein
MFRNPDKLKELENYITNLLSKYNQEGRYKSIKKVIKKSLSSDLNGKKIIRLLTNDEGPLFLTCGQAKKLKDIIESKYTEMNYSIHHILGARILDFWNIEKIYGINIVYCYYDNLGERPLPKMDSLTKFLESYRNSLYEADRDDKSENKKFELLINPEIEKEKKKKRRHPDDEILNQSILTNKRARKTVNKFSPC